MTTQLTIGEVDWETADVPGERNNERVSDFMTLEQGDNKGRVLSNPQQFYVHWVVDETGKKRKVNCAAAGCPVCLRGQDGDKNQARWLIKFLNRKEGRIQLLEISSQVFKGIKTLVQDPEWGSVAEYDINIKRGSPGAQPLYTVIPGRHSPLSVEEKQALATFNDRVEVERFISPPTPEVVAEKLGWAAPSGAAKTVTNDFSSGTKPNGNGSVKQGAAKVSFDFE